MSKLKTAQQHLANLVAIPSVTANKAMVRRAVDYMAKELESLVDIQIHQSQGHPSLIATSRPGNTNPKLWLVGHLDVVAAHQTAFKLTEKDGRLYGRGSIDNKCAAAAFLEAVQSLGADVKKYDFGIMLTGDEEVGGKNGAGYLLDALKLSGEVAFVPDSGTDWTIESKAKGVLHLRIESTGKVAHGALPWEGENAIDKLVKTLTKMRRELKITNHKLAKRHHLATMNVGMINGGQVINQVAGYAEAYVDIRFPEPSQLDEFRGSLAKVCPVNSGISVVELATATPVVVSPDNPWLVKYSDILASHGIAADLKASCGTTDARFFAAKGIPTIVSQPHGGNMHAENEWVDKKGFEQLVHVVKELIQST